MKLTKNEKLIWAAVFAKHWSISNPPHPLCLPDHEEERRRWEINLTGYAAVTASHALAYLGETEDWMRDNYEENSPEWLAYKAMMSE